MVLQYVLNWFFLRWSWVLYTE